MILGGRRALVLLFLGDLVTFVVSLWLTLFVRYGEWPRADILSDHLAPFSVLFIVWTLVFYMSGLYGKRMLLAKARLSEALMKTQIFNILLAALFFFLVPAVGIAPKTNLIIYLVISLVLIFIWRLVGYPRVSARRERLRATLIAEGEEADELFTEVNGDARYHITFTHRFTPDAFATLSKELRVEALRVPILVLDLKNPTASTKLSELFAHADIGDSTLTLDFADLYEEVFDRIPLSRLTPEWFMQHITLETPFFYAITKRGIDLVGGLLMGLITLIVWPIIWIANSLEHRGPTFITQVRYGERGTKITAYKFRSMRLNKSASSEWTTEEKNENPITRVGAFLRKTSLDEFPQFINILKGEISLIGPRNDTEGLGNRLAQALPHYTMRYLVRPGITGWAQINQQYEQGNLSPQSIEETKTRLAYDFYYIKNRSLGLDLVIALKTIKRMFFRVSSW